VATDLGPKARSSFLRVVDWEIQGTLLLRAVLHWSFLLAASFVVLCVWEILTGEPHLTLIDHVGVIWARYSACFIILLVLQPVVVHDTLKLSSRLAGPLFRLRRAMQDAVEGKPLRPINFRKGDFCQDLAKNFNSLIERLPAEETARPDQVAVMEQV